MRHISLEEAWEVHRRVLVFDGHNDTPVERVHRGEGPLTWMERDEAFHMDVPRMQEGSFNGGFFVVGNGPTADVMVTLERTLEQIERNPQVLRLVLASRDVEEAGAQGQIGILMTIEGAGRWLKGELDMVRLYYRLGVRTLGITHGEGGAAEEGFLQGSKSPFGPCTMAEREEERKNAAGLTRFGCEVLKLSNELGLVTDLAHINDRAFYEVLEQSAKPVTMTHTAVCALCPHWRCLTDDQIRALAAAGGVFGIAFAPFFIDAREATVDRLVEHICYAVEMVGIDHVAIGSDFDGLGSTPPVVPGVEQLVLVTQSMLAHGFSEGEIGKVWSGNFVRLLQQNID